MRLWNTLRERRAARRGERKRQAEEDLELISRGEAQDLTSYKRAIRRDYVSGRAFPRQAAGCFPRRPESGLLAEGKGH
jgi:hypothetical protein